MILTQNIMKKTLSIIPVLLLTGFISMAQEINIQINATTPDIKGAWNLTYMKTVSNGSVAYSYPGNLVGTDMKIWSGNHFACIGRFTMNGELLNNYVGGTYTLNGNRYQENIEYHANETAVGAKPQMLLVLKGDTLIQTWPVDTGGKIDSKNYSVEKYVRLDDGNLKQAKNTEHDVHLNQPALFSKWLTGTWKSEVAKDTFFTFVALPFGTGFDCFVRFETNGAVYLEGRSLIGYDSKTNKFIQTEMFRGTDAALYEAFFIQDNLCLFLKMEEGSKNLNQQNRMELQFISPVYCTMKFFKDNSLFKVEHYYREGSEP